MEQWQQEETQAIWLAVGLVILLILVGAIILFTRIYLKRRLDDAQKMANMEVEHQKKLVNDSILVQENERQRIASDLHDELITKLNILLLTNYSDEESQNNELLQDCITTARRISHDLSPALLEQNTIIEFIEELLSHLMESFDVQFHYTNLAPSKIPGATKLQVLRIIQEVINNTLKHADAKSIVVNIRISKSSVGITIQDDGKGFEMNNGKVGLGLSNIEMRTQMLDGKHKVRSALGKGTSYFFLIPNKA